MHCIYSIDYSIQCCLSYIDNKRRKKRQAIEYTLFIEGRRCQRETKKEPAALLIFLIDERIVFNNPACFEKSWKSFD